VVIYSLTHNRLCLSEAQVSSKDPQRHEFLNAVVTNAGEDDEIVAGSAVWEYLKKRALPYAGKN
jgi:hypothetical protein